MVQAVADVTAGNRIAATGDTARTAVAHRVIRKTPAARRHPARRKHFARQLIHAVIRVIHPLRRIAPSGLIHEGAHVPLRIEPIGERAQVHVRRSLVGDLREAFERIVEVLGLGAVGVAYLLDMVLKQSIS